MFFGGAATFMALLFEPLGRVVGWGAYVWLTWTIRVVQWTARFPYASVPLELSEIGLVAVYAVIGGLAGLVLLSPERRRAVLQSLRERLSLKLTLGGMALATVVSWFAMLQFPDGKLHVVFMDVGQGDAIFVETPGGVQILVDGGPEGSVLLSELGRHMPFWDRSLDLVVLTHPDADHLSGLVPALERYGVRAVVARRVLGLASTGSLPSSSWTMSPIPHKNAPIATPITLVGKSLMQQPRLTSIMARS
jgi:competence protein ComEC